MRQISIYRVFLKLFALLPTCETILPVSRAIKIQDQKVPNTARTLKVALHANFSVAESKQKIANFHELCGAFARLSYNLVFS